MSSNKRWYWQDGVGSGFKLMRKMTLQNFAKQRQGDDEKGDEMKEV